MDTTTKISDYPKLESPFIRENINGKYVVIPKINEQYRWAFESSIAVEKFDGTNVSILIEDGIIKSAWSRTERIPFFNKGKRRIIEGIYDAYEKGYTEFLADGQHFGECIGEGINGNPYRIKGNVWYPFQHLIDNYRYKFWDKMLAETLNGKSDQQIFDEVSATFKQLWSLHKRKNFSQEFQVPSENDGFDSTNFTAEGIVFYNKEDITQRCKIRRDMWSWYVGKDHKIA